MTREKVGGGWVGTEYVNDNDGTNSETRFSHQNAETGTYLSVTRTIGTSDKDSHVTQSFNSAGEVTNTHSTWTDDDGNKQRLGDNEVVQVGIWAALTTGIGDDYTTTRPD